MHLHAPSYGYESTSRIQAHEIDLTKRIKPTSLLQLMQEASMQNAMNLKVSIWELEKKQISWVLLKKDIHINRWPILGESIRVMSYPAGLDRIFAFRDYIVYDMEDKLIASASSTWTLMNLTTRKLERIPESLTLRIPKNPEDTLPRPFSKLKQTDQYEHSYEYIVRYFDLDWNGHVNNVSLSRMMLQGLPIDHWTTHIMTRYSIQIKAECKINESLMIQTTLLEGVAIHRIISSKNVLIALGNSHWKEL